MLVWLRTLLGRGPEPVTPDPLPATPAFTARQWIRRIGLDDFDDAASQATTRAGIHEITVTLRGHDDEWLAEVGYDKITKSYFRVQRDRQEPRS